MKNTKHKYSSSIRLWLKSRHHLLKATLWFSLGIIILIALPINFFYLPKTTKQNPASSEKKAVTEVTSPAVTNAPKTIPPSFDISIPYAPQAPSSNWAIHEESCEEAAIYMYRAFLENLSYPGGRITDIEADGAFRVMKDWQISNYGKEPDLTMAALGSFASSFYGYTPTVKKGITADDIKLAVSEDHPVIVPVMTHSLENNMYGPISVYHVLLIKGYDATGVITNDSGVGNGVNKHYNWDILWQAIDAQTEKMGQGRELLYLTK
jgi:hypothetical protein